MNKLKKYRGKSIFFAFLREKWYNKSIANCRNLG